MKFEAYKLDLCLTALSNGDIRLFSVANADRVRWWISYQKAFKKLLQFFCGESLSLKPNTSLGESLPVFLRIQFFGEHTKLARLVDG